MRLDARSPVLKWRNRRLVSGNLRKVVGIKSLLALAACKKRRNPLSMPSGGLLDGGAIDAAPALGKALQLPERGVEKTESAGIGAALYMVIRRRELDETLQKKMN